jgi:hypothetical protein
MSGRHVGNAIPACSMLTRACFRGGWSFLSWVLSRGIVAVTDCLHRAPYPRSLLGPASTSTVGAGHPLVSSLST